MGSLPMLSGDDDDDEEPNYEEMLLVRIFNKIYPIFLTSSATDSW